MMYPSAWTIADEDIEISISGDKLININGEYELRISSTEELIAALQAAIHTVKEIEKNNGA